jgi:hypothetical protein
MSAVMRVVALSGRPKGNAVKDMRVIPRFFSRVYDQVSSTWTTVMQHPRHPLSATLRTPARVMMASERNVPLLLLCMRQAF